MQYKLNALLLQYNIDVIHENIVNINNTYKNRSITTGNLSNSQPNLDRYIIYISIYYQMNLIILFLLINLFIGMNINIICWAPTNSETSWSCDYANIRMTLKFLNRIKNLFLGA